MSGVRLKENIRSAPDPSLKGKGWAVIAIMVVILVAFTVWMIVLLSREQNAPVVNQRCNVGLCAFSAITGIKRCPAAGDTEGLIIDLGMEFCTTRDYCQNNNFPCAVQIDQTLDCSGVCGPGNNSCRCVANPGI